MCFAKSCQMQENEIHARPHHDVRPSNVPCPIDPDRDLHQPAPAAVLLLLLLLAAPGAAEPPPGPYVLAVAAISGVDGISGARAGLFGGARIRVSDSINLLADARILHAPKIETGDGMLYAAGLHLELHGRRWFGSLGAWYAVQTTSQWTKEAWAPQFTIGRQLGSCLLSSTWSGPDTTENRASRLGVDLAWRRGHLLLYGGLDWLTDRGGSGLSLRLGAGWAR